METNFGNIHLSGTSKALLNKLQTKQITLDEFLRDCAFWAIKDGFDELEVLQEPTPPNTQAFREYDNLPLDRKQKVDTSFFVKNEEINKYYQQVNWVRQRNSGRLVWLKEIIKYLPQDDIILRQKVESRIFEFQAVQDKLSAEADKIKEVFNAVEA